MGRRIPIGFALLATKCTPIPLALERLDSKDSHRPAQCRQSDRGLNSSDTIVTRWMRTDKRSSIAGQIIVAAAISLRNPAHVGRQASNADKAWEPRTFHLCIYIYFFQPVPIIEFFEYLSSWIGRDPFLLASRLITSTWIHLQFSSNQTRLLSFRITRLMSQSSSSVRKFLPSSRRYLAHGRLLTRRCI